MAEGGVSNEKLNLSPNIYNNTNRLPNDLRRVVSDDNVANLSIDNVNHCHVQNFSISEIVAPKTEIVHDVRLTSLEDSSDLEMLSPNENSNVSFINSTFRNNPDNEMNQSGDPLTENLGKASWASIVRENSVMKQKRKQSSDDDLVSQRQSKNQKLNENYTSNTHTHFGEQIKENLSNAIILQIKSTDSGQNIANRNILHIWRDLLTLDHNLSSKRIKSFKDAIQIRCDNLMQADLLRKVDMLDGLPVTCSEVVKKTVFRYVIHDVPEYITSDDIIAETGAQNATRLLKRVSDKLLPTNSFIVSFNEVHPHDIYIGFKRFKCRIFYDAPRRCQKCQRFGHKSDTCRRKLTCPRCANSHHFSECPIKTLQDGTIGDADKLRCINCNGNHGAAFKGCPIYRKFLEEMRINTKRKTGLISSPRDNGKSINVVPHPLSFPPLIGPPPTAKPVSDNARVNRIMTDVKDRMSYTVNQPSPSQEFTAAVTSLPPATTIPSAPLAIHLRSPHPTQVEPIAVGRTVEETAAALDLQTGYFTSSNPNAHFDAMTTKPKIIGTHQIMTSIHNDFKLTNRDSIDMGSTCPTPSANLSNVDRIVGLVSSLVKVILLYCTDLNLNDDKMMVFVNSLVATTELFCSNELSSLKVS